MKTIQWTTEKLPSWIFSSEEHCTSVIVPLHRLPAEKMADPLLVQKAITRAKAMLEKNVKADLFLRFSGALDDIYDQIDFTKNAEGIGLFVSETVQEQVWFYLSVQEKIVISGNFAIRDWLYQHAFAQPYFVLHLDEKKLRLFNGTFQHLQEVHDAQFPIVFDEEYEYSAPSRGSSYVGHAFVKQFENDKAQGEQLHYESFLHQADPLLKRYVTDLPLLVAGTTEHLSAFKKVSDRFVVAELKGNFNHNISQLALRAFEAWKQWLDRFKDERLAELVESMGRKRAVTGLDECWKTMKEKNALRLLVEKDFAQAGFLLQGNSYNLLQHVPEEPHTVLADAVNDLILVALNQNTEVIMMENGSLRKLGRIGVMTRY